MQITAPYMGVVDKFSQAVVHRGIANVECPVTSKSFFVLGLLVGTLSRSVFAETDSLGSWERSMETPATQQKILNRIFAGQIGPITEARPAKDGSYLFPKGGMWARLSKSFV